MEIVNKTSRGFPFFRLLAGVLPVVALYFSLPWLGERIRLEPFLSRCSWLKVKEVSIDAEWPLTPGIVRSWLPKLEQSNILLVNGTRIVNSLEQQTWVKSVSFKKVFPDRLELRIETKRPVAISLERGKLMFLDSDGNGIDRATPFLMGKYDFPVVSWERELDAFSWPRKRVVSMIESLQRTLLTPYVSQVGLGAFPHFRVFLVNPKAEVVLDWENWESQVPRLVQLLRHPPRSLGPIARIDLSSSKKAVVSSFLSN